MAGKPGAATPYSAKAGHTGNAGHTPFPSQREPPPPLDRITPQDTPTQVCVSVSVLVRVMPTR